MLRTFAVSFFVCSTVLSSAFSQDEEESQSKWDKLKDRLYFSGTAQQEWAYDYGSGDTHSFELTIEPELEIELADDWNLTIIGRFRADAVDELSPGRPNQPTVSGPDRRVLIGDQLEIELREFYVETSIGETYLTLGKQQIVWGQADGLKVLDVVNPQDFREFVLEDFDDSRIPLWTLNVEVPIGNSTIQFLWIPDQTYHILPEFGSTFEFTSNVPSPPPFIRSKLREPDRPSRVIADSDAGIRWSSFINGWDLTLNYLYHYDDAPVFRRRFVPGLVLPRVVVEPEYERTHLFGGTFSNTFGNLTLRGEVGYSWDKFFSTTSLLDRDGVIETDEFSYVIGFDWFGFNETFLSAQLFQSILADEPSGLLRDKVETNVSLNITRDFKNDTIIASLLAVHNLNQNDGFVRPKVSYEYSSSLTFWAGLDIFYGTREGFFGQYNGNDRFILGGEWSF